MRLKLKIMIVLTLIWKISTRQVRKFCILLTLSIGFDESNGADYFMFIYIAPNGYFQIYIDRCH